MLSILSALVAGLIFGLGLMLSGMGNPAKVQNFLDFFGTWDPSLALVMVGAIAVGLIAFSWAKRRKTALLGEPMQLPTASVIDTRLLLGSAMFGIGWGLAGFCPGPALMNLFTMHKEVVIFVVSMVVGMLLQQTWARKK
ncbi:YeeE/YedE family protein [Diaphorobacter sp. HDW4A]|uniref:YeeE/YedE family protein n=1 Tax=Diaphorobacter sp. HDW4A TaxID=2714924 RepID=UPI00140A9728|nr:YeeE/YedE family protein [Diaphorobacter sp. HDW4A]QIL79345.1 YeeE/YedE family protein [Diaphorobacter sp. HDW4A]